MAADRNRTTIAGLMFLTVIAAVLLAALRHGDRPWFWITLIVTPNVVPWIVAPVKLRRNVWQPIDIGHRPFDPSAPDVPAAVPLRLDAATADLLALGFVSRGSFRSAPTSHATQYVGLFERPATWEVARLMINTTRTFVHTTLVYQTTFADGVELLTSDSGELPPWPRRQGVEGMAFPEVRSTADLFEIHRAMVAREGGRPVRDLPASDEALVDHFRATVEKNRAWPIALGLYEVDDARGVFRPTWKGAFRNAWGRLWPVGPIRKALRRRRARQTLRELVHEGRLAEKMIRA